MRQIWITKIGSPEVLELREADDPRAGAGQVRIRTRAAGINFADLLARMGVYPDAPKAPFVPGYELSGVIDEVGAGVEGLAAGDRVLALLRFGGYSDVVTAPAAAVFRLPPAMTFEEGAALPVAYLTAHHMLLFTGALRPGMRILVDSAAGGVGLAAVQLARAHGAVILGSATAGKHEFLRAQGVQFPLDSAGNRADQVRRALGPGVGLDLVLDASGGPASGAGYRLLAPGGRLVCYGVFAMAPGKTRSVVSALRSLARMKWWNPLGLMADNKTVTGVNLGRLVGRMDLPTSQMHALLELYRRGDIKPVIDRAFPFAEAAAAHHYLHSRKARGKLLLTP